MVFTPGYRYMPPRFDNVESVEKYHPGGFHPVQIGDVFAKGRYEVLHKLGFGGFSTIWLARDLQSRQHSTGRGRLVSLKIMLAEESRWPASDIPDVCIPRELTRLAHDLGHPGGAHIRMYEDVFVHEGPNGQHLCLVSEFAGPSLSGVHFSPGRVLGSRRLRADLARKVARQLVTAVDLLHTAGVVHGDLTSSNVLFRLRDDAQYWSDVEVIKILGKCELDEVYTSDGSPAQPHAPEYIIEAIEDSRLCSSSLLREDIVLIDFGQSFFADSRPPNHIPGIQVHYLAPETYFDRTAGFASDIWALACLLFEIRTGYTPFDDWFGSVDQTFKEVVQTLGRFPDPWWAAWEARTQWFDEAGALKPCEEQAEQSVIVAQATSLLEKLREVGQRGNPPSGDDGDMIEKMGMKMDEDEIVLMEDLLRRMLRYQPEERITIKDVLNHPWFEYS